MVHGLNCSFGPNVIRRHDEIRDELALLSRLYYTGTSIEPVIKKPDESKPEGHPDRKGKRGDVLVRGMHASQTDAIIDVRVVNLDAQSRVHATAESTLKSEETNKNTKHRAACEARRIRFVPFVVSTDGCLGPQADSYPRLLARCLSAKWEKPYSVVVSFLRMRVAFSIVRASSSCMRGPRNAVQGHRWVMHDGAALDLMTFE